VPNVASSRHPGDEIGRRRRGIPTHVELSPALRRLVDAEAARFGIAKKDVIVAALVRHFASELTDVKELAKLAKTWMQHQIQQQGRRP
jgi:hypothetical protein